MRIYCKDLNITLINSSVLMCGWVNNIRILKKIIFIELRDVTGTIQIVLKKKKNSNIWKKILLLTHESCIKIIGFVKFRNNIDDKLEILVKYIKIFNYSKSLPLDLKKKNNENVRLKYRYLDLRKDNMLSILKLKSNIKFFINDFFYKNNFIEVETPFLSKSFSEGARSYSVLSRIYKNKFYSLPQSPQIFKQLLMISGIDKYFQIVKCFRDEDLRSDRQPEFTQIDIELSFSNFNILRNVIEKLLSILWLEFKCIDISNLFFKINYIDCIRIYGTDKPDLRNIVKYNLDISNFFINNSLINEINLDNFKTILINNINNFDINDINNFLNNKFILKYLYIHVVSFINGKYIYKVFGNFKIIDDLIVKILFNFNIPFNSFIIFIWLDNSFNVDFLLKIRNFFCKKFSLFLNKDSYFPLWIVNFPMFFYDEYNLIKTYHHPFTMPINFNLDLLKSNINYNKILSNSYDLVINGYELGSGSQRIHDFYIQKEIFSILGINNEYNFFLEALKYGTPPHLGIALGLDRIIMLLCNNNNIKDVIAFPKTTSGICLLTGSPN